MRLFMIVAVWLDQVVGDAHLTAAYCTGEASFFLNPLPSPPSLPPIADCRVVGTAAADVAAAAVAADWQQPSAVTYTSVARLEAASRLRARFFFFTRFFFRFVLFFL